ncbi:MAG: class I SAM-dependent methyltransferase [Bryobacteraceae bacterium]
MPRRIYHHGRSAQKIVIYDRLRDNLPAFLRRYVMHFETAIEDAVREFATSLPKDARLLDAGAGEGNYKHYFARQRYCGLDLGIGDQQWNYAQLDVIGDLSALPFRDHTFDACVNVVTLEHVKEPALVIREIARTLTPGARFLLIVPFEWEEHQQPHDYFRFTRYSLAYLFYQAGLEIESIRPVGGFFRLLSRRMLYALQFFPGPLILIGAIFFVPPALLLPLLEPLDRRQNFTLGYICSARKPL